MTTYHPSLPFWSGINNSFVAPLNYTPTLSSMASSAASASNYAESLFHQKNTADIDRLTRSIEALDATDILAQTMQADCQALFQHGSLELLRPDRHIGIHF